MNWSTAKLKVGQVWKTHSGNLALIVMEADTGKLKMLWRDEFDGWTVSEILNRLDTRQKMSEAEFFTRVAKFA